MAKIVYICGPITGKPEGNHITFHKAATWYRNRGFIVWNPYEIAADFATITPESVIMRSELAQITAQVDIISLLPNWEESRGSLVEVAAGIISGIPFIKAFSFETVYPNLTIQADGCKTSKRLVAESNQSAESINPNEQVPSKQGAVGKYYHKAEFAVERLPVCRG